MPNLKWSEIRLRTAQFVKKWKKIAPKPRELSTMLLLWVIVLGITGCFHEMSNSSSDRQIYKSYRDIPNITAEEIAGIESLKESRDFFVYGIPETNEAFPDADGEIKGYAPLFCEWLTELFGIPFVPKHVTWLELLDGLKTGLVDFTGELTPSDERRQTYFMTSAIARRWLCYFRLDGTEPLRDIARTRPLRYALIEGSTNVEDTFKYENEKFEPVYVTGYEQVYELLKTGEVDAFVTENTAESFFDAYGDVVMENFFPFIDCPVSLSTQNPNLEPVISVVQKALEDGAYRYLSELYDRGYNEYKKQKLFAELTAQEKDYIKANPVIPYAAEYDNYPLSFYNTRSNEWQGANLDILREVGLLTGLEFEIVNDEHTEWHELLRMLETGQVLFVTELLRTQEREGRFLWPNTAVAFNRPALISMTNHNNISISKIPTLRVGVQRATAYVELFRSWFPNHSNLIIYESQSAYYSALLNGEVDMVMGSYNSMLYLTNYLERVDIKPNILFDNITESTFGFHKEAFLLCSIFDKALKLIDTNIISDQWMHKTYDYRAKMAEAQRPWLIGSTALALAVLSLVTLLFYRNRKVAIEKGVLRESQKAILDILPTGVIIMTRENGTLLYANKAGLDLFNCKSFEEDVAGRRSFEFMAEIQPGGKSALDFVLEMRKKDKAVVEMQCVKLTGETFLARVVYCIINYNGTFASLNVIEDMTAEKDRRQMLQDIATKEQEANQLKTRFLAKMSHEIRTPMNAIIGMSELALRENNADIIKKHIFTVKQAGSNLLSIINDILDFSKIESGKLEIVPAEYSVPLLLNDVINIIRMRIIKTPLRFAVKIDNNIPHTLIGDDSRIRQVLINLLGNAVKYTDNGFVSLSVKGRIADENTVELSMEIEDSGIGIKQEDLSSLFKDFTQLDTERNKGIEGVGLGLAISDNIVRTMGGSISVESEYGKGSIFTVTLPQKYKNMEPLAVVADPEHKKILVYERRKTYISSIVFAMDNLGVEYNVVSNGTELHEKMSVSTYDFLFIPFVLFEKNRETIGKFGKQTRTVFLSEYGESIYDRDMDTITITIPVYCVPVANILNGVSEKHSLENTEEPGSSFTAPDVKVLVVDDIYTNLHVAKGLMSRYNMVIDLCNGGKAAIEAVEFASYDLIFMDHKMPGMDGIEATQIIRAMGDKNSRHKNVPIIALTANAVSGTREMFIENGFNDFISKPIDTVKLHEILKKWIPKEKQKVNFT